MPESRRQNEWTEGVAIWIAVIVVSCVGESACLGTCTNHRSLLMPHKHLYCSSTMPLFTQCISCLSSQLALATACSVLVLSQIPPTL